MCFMAVFETACKRLFGLVRRLSLHTSKLPGIDDSACSRDRLKSHFISRNFGNHEGVVGVEAFGSDLASVGQAAFSQLCTAPENEVLDVLLRLDTFIEMLMPGEYNVHTVLDEQRLKYFSQFELGPMFLSGRIDRMVEEGNLPLTP